MTTGPSRRGGAPVGYIQDLGAVEAGAEGYLLTNRKCAAAIHLYEKLGFAHDSGVMDTYAARYERCDVAMLYKG